MIRKLLQKYIEWESDWFTPKMDMKPGEVVKINWKYKVMFPYNTYAHGESYTVKLNYDAIGVVEMTSGVSFKRYWLTRPISLL